MVAKKDQIVVNCTVELYKSAVKKQIQVEFEVQAEYGDVNAT